MLISNRPHPQPAPSRSRVLRESSRARTATRDAARGRTGAYALVVAATVFWGLAGIATKGALDVGVGATEIAFWRLLLGGGLFALHAGCRRDLKLAARADLGPLIAFALLVVALHYLAFNIAVDRGGVSLVNLFLAGVPIFVALAAPLFLGERLAPWKLVLGALSAAGLVLVAGGGGRGVDANPVSVGASLVVALTVVGFTVAAKGLLRRYAPTTLNAFVLPLGALLLLPFVDFAPKTPQAWLLLALLALVPTYLAHLCYMVGLKRIDASSVALLANVEAVVALGAAAVLFGERLTASGLVGVALILGASLLLAVPRERGVRRAGSGRRELER